MSDAALGRQYRIDNIDVVAAPFTDPAKYCTGCIFDAFGTCSRVEYDSYNEIFCAAYIFVRADSEAANEARTLAVTQKLTGADE